jgi:hypothetical protein
VWLPRCRAAWLLRCHIDRTRPLLLDACCVALDAGSSQASVSHASHAYLSHFAPPQAYLFSALRHARLVPPDADLGWPDLQYSRGGRTDKGVSGEQWALLLVEWWAAQCCCQRAGAARERALLLMEGWQSAAAAGSSIACMLACHRGWPGLTVQSLLCAFITLLCLPSFAPFAHQPARSSFPGCLLPQPWVRWWP